MGFGLRSENLARQTSQTGLLCGLPAIAGQMRDDEGKNDGDHTAGNGWRDTGALSNIFHHRLAETLLDLVRTNGLIFSGADPGLNLFAQAVLL
jgi:hypothetical protein